MENKIEEKRILNAKNNIDDFNYLYDFYFPKINNFVYHRIADNHTREEIVSNVFYKTMSNLNRFKIFSSWNTGFSTWIFRIALNEINQYYRSQKRENKLISNVKILHQTPTEFEKIELDYELLKDKLQFLKEDEQNIITLRYFEKMRIKEIAKIFKKNENSMKVKIHRTIKKLRKLFEEEHDETI